MKKQHENIFKAIDSKKSKFLRYLTQVKLKVHSQLPTEQINMKL